MTNDLTTARTRALTGVRVFDGERLGEPATVVWTGDTITAIVPDGEPYEADETVRGEGKVLLPGLVDAHVHVARRADLDALVAHGVTTALDMGSWPPERTAALREERGTAALRSAGVPFIGPHGAHSHFGMPEHAIVTDPADVPDGVRRRLADGSDYLKVVTEPAGAGGPAPEVVAAVAREAHDNGRLLVAHTTTVESFETALAAGADVLTHVPRQEPIGDDLARRIADAGRAAVPTLACSRALMQAMPAPGATYESSRESVAAMLRAGVPVLAGTDAVATEGIPFSIPHGESLLDELELLVDAGMTPVEALRAATSAPADLFGLADRGRVEVGLRADLLLVDGDPTTDVRDIHRVAGVWVAGEPVLPAR